MAISPISSISFKNNAGVKFTSRKGNDSEGQEFVPSQKRGITDLSKMPVVVLLAMTPALTNAKTPENDMYMPIPPSTEMLYEAQEPEEEDDFFIRFSEVHGVQQSKAPYDWENLKMYNIRHSQEGKCPIYPFNMVFAAEKGAGITDTKEITHIFLVPKDQKGSNEIYTRPPYVRELIYHNTGDGKEFFGVKVIEDILDENGHKEKSMVCELKLDNNTINTILKFLLNESSWKNATDIKYVETTSPKKLSPKVY